MVALVAGIVAVSVFDLAAKGVSVVGPVATGLSTPSLPDVPLSTIPYLVVGAAGMVFLAVGESIGAASFVRGAPSRTRSIPTRSSSGSARANLSSGLFGGFTVDASLSQTATGESAGSKSQLSSVITSALVLATAVFLAPLFKNLPNAVLGAIVIVAVLGLMDVREMRRYWAWRRTDFVIALVAMVGVILTSVLTGLVIAVLLSLTFLLYRASRPHVASLGLLAGYDDTYVDLERHADARPIPGLLIVRLDAPLYFFNANVAQTQIRGLLSSQAPAPRAVLIDLASTADLDVTTTDMLFELARDLRARSIDLLPGPGEGRCPRPHPPHGAD